MESLTKGFETLANNFEAGAHDFETLPNDIETLAKDFETITRGRWEWKSNLNPWSETEPAQWEPFSLEHNYLIEKAYYDQQKEVDIGDYIVSIKHMIQKKKGYITKQRPIRRINWIDSVDEKDRSGRYLETELPKTMNKIFGSLGDFISFFSRRNQEILDFANRLKEFEQSNDLISLNLIIVPRLIDCVQEVLLKTNEEQLKNTSLSQFQKKTLLNVKKRIEELICLFKTEFSSFEEFYGNTLKAYTMNTDLYPILNNYLRNENWIEIDKLLPYAFCLCKAFFSETLKTHSLRERRRQKSQTLSPRLLYRGTAFDRCTLSFYNREKVKYFSWNSVTSTSKNKKIAEGFMYKNTDLANKKYPVLFVIVIPLANELKEEYLKWIDIHHYSAIPKEDEVILAPGSAFELIGVSTDQDQKTTIQVKLRNEIESLAFRGMMMQGALQSKMMTEKEAKIICLEGEELSQALMSLFGNKLKEEVEFCLCTFDKKSMRKLFEALPTLKRAKTLKFIACMYQENEEIEIERPKEEESCGITKIEVIEANDFFQRVCNDRHDQRYWVSLRELDLDFRSRRSLTDEELDCTVSQGLKYLPQLTSLSINLEECQEITDKGMASLASGLNFLTQLTHLNLNFKWCQQITDEGVNSFAKGLNSLTQLTHLNLNFKWCDQIADESVNSFAKGLSSLTQLTHLNLKFEQCFQITDEGVNSFAKGLKTLTQLTHLILRFGGCEQITDEGVNSFAKGLNSLTRLAHLNLDFRLCKQITNEGVSSLMSQGLKNLTQLTSLIIDFTECKQVTGQDLQVLACKWLEHHISLTSLTVQNKRLQNIEPQPDYSSHYARVVLTREVFHKEKETFYEESLPLQMSLTGSKSPEQSEKLLIENFLEIIVSIWEKNEDFFDGANLSEVFSQIRHLTSLTFGFKKYSDTITDEFLRSLSSQVLRNLPQLRSLTLDFWKCKQITDKGVNDLASHGLKPLNGLRTLKLEFCQCEQVTDKGVMSLACEGLRHLSQLNSLSLDLRMCDKVTDEGFAYLACNGLRHLSQLKSLDLKLSYNVTNEGVDSLVFKGLKYLTQLNSLTLDFSSSPITEKGVNTLILQIVKNLPQLAELDLDLFGCYHVSKSTIRNITQVLHYFGFKKKLMVKAY